MRIHKLNLAEGCNIAAWEEFLKWRYSSPECRAVAKSYIKNLTRAHSLSMIPGFAFMNGEDWGNYVAYAVCELGKDENSKEVIERAERMFVDARNKRHPSQSIFDYREAVENVEKILQPKSLMHDALFGMFESMIVQAWGAFEVLAEDLWKGVTKKRPALNTNSSWPGNWKNAPGFRARSRLANAYRWTFKIDNADILSVVDNTAVHALGIVRNVLVHSGGRIDPAYQKDRLGMLIPPPGTPLISIPELRKIRGRKLGYKINFDGPLTRHFIDPVTPLAFKLVKSVDEWLIAHS